MIRILLAASMTGAAFLSSTSLSWSADAVIEQAVPTGPSWTGFYVGIHAGGAFGNMGYRCRSDFAGPRTRLPFRRERPSPYGIHGGFDYQFSSRGLPVLNWTTTQLEFRVCAV